MDSPSQPQECNSSIENILPNLDQISAIRHKTPQFRIDFEKKKFISIQKNSLDSSVTISIDENSFMKQTNNIENIEDIIQTNESKPNLLINAYSFTSIVAGKKLLNGIKNNLVDYFTRCIWLRVRMPSDQFDYTAAILTNRPSQGLFKSLIYDLEEWSEWMPKIIEIALNKLEPILDLLEGIKYAKSINDLGDGIEKLDNETFYAVQSGLFEIELLIYEFIANVVRLSPLLGKELSFRKRGDIYFKMTDQVVLCLVLSKETYQPVKELSIKGKSSPVRIIKFAYITDIEEYELYENFVGFEERVQILKNHKNQLPESRTFAEAFSRSPIISKIKLTHLVNQNLVKNGWMLKNDYRLFKLYTNSLVLHVEMPKQFGFTCAIISKKIQAGLLHSIARHSNQWAEHVAGFDDVMARLELIRPQLDKIRECGDKDDEAKKAAYKDYFNVYNSLGSNDNLELALLDVQLQVLKRIQHIVTNQPYEGDVVNDERQTTVLFKVDNIAGEAQLLCLGASSNLFPPIREFSDKRPVRSLTTVYFGSYKQYQELDIITGKVWKSTDSSCAFDEWAKLRTSNSNKN